MSNTTSNESKLSKQFLKEKWLNKYIKEMNENQEKRDIEVNYFLLYFILETCQN